MIEATLADENLSRGERQVLTQHLQEEKLDRNECAQIRKFAFEKFRERLHDSRNADLVDWLEDVVRLLEPKQDSQLREEHSAVFAPDGHSVSLIRNFISATKSTLDICVFTITDNRLTDEITAAHQRGVKIRIISDDDKSEDRGSDVEIFTKLNIPVALDDGPDHMHHKFAIADRRKLLNGSYNWTRSAANHNHENIIITTTPELIESFQEEFEKLWKLYK